MKTEDILKFEPAALLDPKVLGDIHPQKILEYRKTMEAQGKSDVVGSMESIANSIDTALPHVKNKSQRDKIRDALLGKGNQGGGKNRKNRS